MYIITKKKLIKLLERSDKILLDIAYIAKLFEKYGDQYIVDNGELVIAKVNTDEV